jgi:hypothetical protein
MTLQKFKIVISGLQLVLKGILSKNISKATIPRPYLHFTAKRSLGIHPFLHHGTNSFF